MGVILGRKIGMTQAFDVDGGLIPVTVVLAGPCRVLEQRTEEKNGYSAAVLGFEEIAGARSRKPQLGFFKKLQAPVFKFIREFRNHEAPVGQDVGVAQFKKGETLTVEGVSIGKGWAGTIKRWNFASGRASHGGNFNRAPGSCGMHTWPARTIKGKKMPGRYGNDAVTLQSVEVVDIVAEDNLLLLRGSVPGAEQSLLKICTSKHQKKKAA
jgi:large subunit ribosomal protein L3